MFVYMRFINYSMYIFVCELADYDGCNVELLYVVMLIN